MKRNVNPEIARMMVNRAASLDIDTMSAGAKLNPDRADEFYRRVREKAVTREYCDVVQINESGVMDMPWLEVSGNVANIPQGLLNPASYNTVKINDDNQQAHTFNATAIVYIEDKTVRENVQGEALTDAVLDLVADQFMANMEEMFLYSNKTAKPAVLESQVKNGGSATDYVLFGFRGQEDGWLEQMETGIVVDAENSDNIAAILGKAWDRYPERYQQYEAFLRWFAPPRLAKNTQLNFASRETGLGDRALDSRYRPTPFGMDIIDVPLLYPNPPHTEHIELTSTTPTALEFKPIKASDVVVLPSTLAGTPVTPYLQGVSGDYVVDEANGTIARTSASNITSGQTVKVQYKTGTKLWLGPPKNMVVGLTRDINIETWRYGPGQGTFYIIDARMGMGIRNPGANVLIKNLKLGTTLTGI